MDLKSIRREKGMTQAAVACVAGMSREAYTNIENGVRRPSVDAAKRIGAALGFNWALLFSETEVIRRAHADDQ